MILTAFAMLIIFLIVFNINLNLNWLYLFMGIKLITSLYNKKKLILCLICEGIIEGPGLKDL